MSTQHAHLIGWLRGLANKGGKGAVDRVDARALGRAGDALDLLAVEVARIKGERDRQYDYNVEQIAIQAKLETKIELYQELEEAVSAYIEADGSMTQQQMMAALEALQKQ